MKALTIYQPWAHLIIYGGPNGYKRVENRNWPTQFRGRLAIHAGKNRVDMTSSEGLDFAKKLEGVVFGMILGTVEVYDCVSVSKLPKELRRHPFASGPWCWLLRDPIPLVQPIPFTGLQGLYTIPDEVLESPPADPVEEPPTQQLLFEE